jgi:hypothetical protein
VCCVYLPQSAARGYRQGKVGRRLNRLFRLAVLVMLLLVGLSLTNKLRAPLDWISHTVMTFATTALHLFRSRSSTLSYSSSLSSHTHLTRCWFTPGAFQPERAQQPSSSSCSDPSVRSVRSISQHPALWSTYLAYFSFPQPRVLFIYLFFQMSRYLLTATRDGWIRNQLSDRPIDCFVVRVEVKTLWPKWPKCSLQVKARFISFYHP